MKVLIVRVGAMGDVLHALPAVAALRRARPDWVIDWVVDERWRTLLGEHDGPVVNRTFAVPVRAWKAKPFSVATLRSLLKFRELRGRYDVVVDMQGTMRSAAIAWLAGGRAVAGYADPREWAAARLYGRRVARTGRHVVEQGLGLLREAVRVALPAEQEDATAHHGNAATAVSIAQEEWAEEWAEREAVLARPLAVLAAGGGWGAKQWPAEKFGALAVGLRERGFDVVVNAARADDATALRVVEASGGAARMVVCNVAGLTALLRRTDLLVGGDSGPMHLAAALAAPVVALFGPTDPARNGPWGPGAKVVLRDAASVTTYKRTEATEAGLEILTVETVLSSITEII